MDAERYHDLIMRRTLGELTPEERRELERELAHRGDAGTTEIDAMREVLGSLGLAAEPREPPRELRDRVLAALPTDAERRGAAPRRGIWPWVAIAATVAAVLLGLNVIRLQQNLDEVRADRDAAQIRAAEAEMLRDSLSSFVSDVSTLIAANPVTLSGTSPEVLGRARVFIDVDSGRTLLLVDDLPVLPPEQVYQLWAISDGQPTSAGVFRLDAEGPAWIELAEDTDLSAADLLAVTIEEAPGAPAPTSAPILASGT